MTLPIVILAGGLATRLRPTTLTIPKILIPIAGKPFLHHLLKLLKMKGFEEVFLCIGNLGEQVEAYIKTEENFGLKIHCFYDGEKLLGTGGAICNILPYLPEAFMLAYGDSYLLCDYSAVEQAFFQSGKNALMTVFRNQGKWDTSNVIYQNGEILIYDKINRSSEMHHIDYGLGVFKRRVFESLPKDTIIDLATIYQKELAQHQLAAFEIKERFFENGSKQGIEDLERYLLTQ